MRLLSIQTTPNPNSIKLNLDEQLGAAVSFTRKSKDGCPQFVEKLLEIKEVQCVFVCADFITLNKDPRADWQHILEQAELVLLGGESDSATIQSQRKSAESDGQVHVFVQTFRGIPIQIKITDSQAESRVSLGARFNEAAQVLQEETGADYLKERYWADYGLRYGTRDEVATELADEIQGSFDDDTLERIKAQALGRLEESPLSFDTLAKWLGDEDWHRRLTAVQELSSAAESVPLLAHALTDAHPQVRRLAAAALGATGSAMAVEPLCDALLSDQSVGVRRTAGDALSDIGDTAAQPAICSALGDASKLVRWRAARFLCDIGTEEALPYLKQAEGDPEFEVRLEIQAAIQRISGGEDGFGPAWKRIVDKL